MGQYFGFRNLTRKEYFEPRGHIKFGGALNENDSARLAFLLYDGTLDGTSLASAVDPKSTLARNALKGTRDSELLREKAGDYESVYRDEDGYWDDDRLRKVGLAGYDMDEVFDYVGRWAGDEVRILGDYASRDGYDTREGSSWTNITGPLYDEMDRVMAEDWSRPDDDREGDGGSIIVMR